MVEGGLSFQCRKSFRNAGRGFSLDAHADLEQGSFTAVMGPSGAGKTTLLRVLAGLVQPDAGEITHKGVTWASESVFVPCQKRRIGYVFQDYALFPHMKVGENIRFGFRGAIDEEWLEHLVSVFRIKDLVNDKPSNLSGGQQQRVALARALAAKPSLLLLDEPMAALDFALRLEIRAELLQITKELKPTVVLVTHDVLEAAALANSVFWMEEGKITKSGTPGQVLKAELQVLQQQLSKLSNG